MGQPDEGPFNDNRRQGDRNCGREGENTMKERPYIVKHVYTVHSRKLVNHTGGSTSAVRDPLVTPLYILS